MDLFEKLSDFFNFKKETKYEKEIKEVQKILQEDPNNYSHRFRLARAYLLADVNFAKKRDYLAKAQNIILEAIKLNKIDLDLIDLYNVIVDRMGKETIRKGLEEKISSIDAGLELYNLMEDECKKTRHKINPYRIDLYFAYCEEAGITPKITRSEAYLKAGLAVPTMSIKEQEEERKRKISERKTKRDLN